MWLLTYIVMDEQMKIDDRFMTTRDAAELACVAPYEIWAEAGRSLSQPVRISQRRCYWLRDEVQKWAAERRKRLALVEAA